MRQITRGRFLGYEIIDIVDPTELVKAIKEMARFYEADTKLVKQSIGLINRIERGSDCFTANQRVLINLATKHQLEVSERLK